MKFVLVILGYFTCLSISLSQASKAWVMLGDAFDEQYVESIGAQYADMEAFGWGKQTKNINTTTNVHWWI